MSMVRSRLQIPDKLLQPREKIVWHGQPVQGMRFRPSDWFVIPFSLVWFTFAFIWTAIASYAVYVAIQDADHFEWPFLIVFPLVGLVFCVAGYQFVVGRFTSDAENRARTIYALSNARAFVMLTGDDGYVQVLQIDKDTDITSTIENDGVGTIWFMGGEIVTAEMTDGRTPPDGFEFADVPRAKEVLREIERIKRGHG